MIINEASEIPFNIVSKGDLDLDELQSDIPEKIAAAKCRLAARVVGGPVLVDDTSLCFSALGGLPGPYIKWYVAGRGTASCAGPGRKQMGTAYQLSTHSSFLPLPHRPIHLRFQDKLGGAGLVKMLRGFDDRGAWALCSVAFSPGPGAEPCVFIGRTDGVIVDCDGIGGFGWDAIFQPNSANTTFAKMSTEEKNKCSHRGRALRQLAAFLSENEEWVYGRAAVRKREPREMNNVMGFRRRRKMV